MRIIRNLRFPLWFALLSLLSLGAVACGDSDGDGSGGSGGQATGGTGGDPGSGGDGGTGGEDPGSGGDGGTGGSDPGTGGTGGGTGGSGGDDEPDVTEDDCKELDMDYCKVGVVTYCTDLKTDVHNCGQCANDCKAVSGNAMCNNGICS